MKISKIFNIVLLSLFFTITVFGQAVENNDLHLNGYAPMTGNQENYPTLKATENFTVLDFARYQLTVNEARALIRQLIDYLKPYKNLDANARMELLAKQLIDIPFIESGAMGEGDWQSGSDVYQPGAAHVKQDPVYRMDGLNCQTFVQNAMALFYSFTLDEFDRNILKINYGAAGNPHGEWVHYFNRNNFIDGDWNPVNQKNGFLQDVTSQSDFGSVVETTIANITRNNWFLRQKENLHATVRVLNHGDGFSMAQRYATVYSGLDFPGFNSEIVATSYVPKTVLAIKQSNGKYSPNKFLIDKVPTPSIIEIVRDAGLWTVDNKNIKDATGSELSISHMGILYQKQFKNGDVIYNRLTCNNDSKNVKKCIVTPIICAEKVCKELMFLHASNAWPNGYYWYKKSNNQYACTASLPKNVTHYTSCNRVQEQPLFDYLTDYQYGSYRNMDNQSILGIHIEKLLLHSLYTQN